MILSWQLSAGWRHVRRHYSGEKCVCRLRTHRYAQRNPGTVGTGTAELSHGSHGQQSVPVLREEPEPAESAAVGTGWLCPAEQATVQRKISVASYSR